MTTFWTVTQEDDCDGTTPWTFFYSTKELAKQACREAMQEMAESIEDDEADTNIVWTEYSEMAVGYCEAYNITLYCTKAQLGK